jgi:hypothetical protein
MRISKHNTQRILQSSTLLRVVEAPTNETAPTRIAADAEVPALTTHLSSILLPSHMRACVAWKPARPVTSVPYDKDLNRALTSCPSAGDNACNTIACPTKYVWWYGHEPHDCFQLAQHQRGVANTVLLPSTTAVPLHSHTRLLSFQPKPIVRQ